MARRIAGALVILAVAVTVFAVLARDRGIGLGWSAPPPIDFTPPFGAFSIYPWAALALWGIVFVAGAVAAVRRSGRIASAALVSVALIGAAVIYLPITQFAVRRLDRVRGYVDVRASWIPQFAVVFIIILAVHGALIAVAATRHTPELTRSVARGSAVVTCGIFLHLFWIWIVFPFIDEWVPADWHRADLLRPARLCRGAMLWDHSMAIGRIDDLWLNVRGERAVSFVGRFREGYYWITVPEARKLSVRIDDPAVIDCDGTWRREPVAPAAWHKIGWSLR